MRYIIAFLFFSVSVIAQEQFTIYFDFNKEMPNTSSTEVLQQWIAANKNAKIVAIHGFADAADNNDYNHNLSQRRINAVAGILKEAGIAIAEDAIMKPYGESEASGDDEKDRRVVVYFVPQAIEKQIAEPVKKIRKPLEASMFVKGSRVVLEGLLFFPDTDEIIPESAGALAELAAIMINNPNLKIEIHGHMCCSPYDRTNLSGDRAKRVYKNLISKGVGKRRMQHKGYGVTRPVYNIPEKNEAERLANRRVEIEVVEN